MKFYIKPLLLLVYIPVFSFSADIENRVEILEDELNALKSRITNKVSVGSLRSKKINLGGYFVLQSEAIKGGTYDPSSFKKMELEMIISGKTVKNWSYFSEVEFESVSTLNDEHMAIRKYSKHNNVIKLERLWLKYDKIPQFIIQAGLIFTPIGIINRTHYQPIILATDRTLFLKNGSITRKIGGVNFSGKKSSLTYQFYAGSDIEQKNSPFTGGAHLGYKLDPIDAIFGISFQDTQRESVGNTNIYGLDFNINWRNAELKTEFFIDSSHGKGHYIQPAYTINSWKLFYRYDFADIDTKNTTDADHKRQIFGINYLISGDKRIKVDYQKYDYKKKKDADNNNKDYSKIVFELAFTI